MWPEARRSAATLTLVPAMYDRLVEFFTKPAPFFRTATDMLWCDPHIAANMLRFHLDETGDLASRRPDAIDRMVDWIDVRFGLAGKTATDLGCGPGLYARRMAARGARVTGLDFSAGSIAYARETSGGAVTYHEADYLRDALPREQDLVFLIYGDLCALSPTQRQTLYGRVADALTPDGRFVFDVFSQAQFAEREENVVLERGLMGGFWAAGDYFGLQATFLYGDAMLALDRYLIVEPARTREILNWMQYFSPDTITEELGRNGFDVLDIVDAVTGEGFDGTARPFAVIAAPLR